ncbi:hypothetical protein [Nonomuraea basaltis]|uniref:hypothetical protein n=1 Tax=Nonomuraea basaltis TaxID=2495887 RepID=UPI00110C50F0|nr:hypothetical protein [Nonomuraea basaltis]TMR88606.1 hypothetical protein EJK15_65270 [Nonomuraea basaltis]
MSTYEYGVRYTNDTGQSGIAYDPDKFDPRDRAFADMRCRGMHTAQEDRDIPKDATLMRRLPGGEWEADPQWAAEIGAWNEYVVQVEALWDAGRDDEARAFRDNAESWLSARQAELLAAAGEAR